ncbi:MAG: NUDIX hydrolase [Myxococcota bacterium]|jgi:8-oxo-dGTP pyrophosphatase MutT (NUDIX family)|nr:NUDIX hydrolase [Myxococcota bacterium]
MSDADDKNRKHEERLAEWAKSGKEGTKPVNAATVILLRDTDGDGDLETLMLRRNSKIAFGGMWVFPGGRVDDADREGLAEDDELGAARRAAVREAHEESGLDISEADLAALSHWTPPPITPKRFLTWFFVAEAPESEVVIDQGEIEDHVWLSVREALDRRDQGEIELAPPTFVTLQWLAAHRSVGDAVEDARNREPEFFSTRIAVSDDGPVAMWQGDAGYEASDANVDGARHRLSMHKGVWTYERSE